MNYCISSRWILEILKKRPLLYYFKLLLTNLHVSIILEDISIKQQLFYLTADISITIKGGKS